jgi:hypothetical protein
MTTTPCVGNAAVYDTALYDEDVPPARRTAAIHTAASLCNGCPINITCGDRVTLDSAPTELVLLPADWMPPEREGTAAPEAPPVRRRSARRLQAAAITTGRDYVKPAQRPAVWARMAAGLIAEGRTVAQTAEALCVSEDTVHQLLGAPVVGLVA